MGRADLHIHSDYSDGFPTVEQILTHTERKTDLDVIAITDHDCIDGALVARDLAVRKRSRIGVIVGAEISTRDGHLLALDIKKLIPAGLGMGETIQAIHEQGGLAVIAHPLSRWCPSAKMAILEALATGPHSPDGVEIYNGSFAGIGSNSRVREVNDARFRWSETGGSDAHNRRAIGESSTGFPGSSAADLLNAIRRQTTIAYGGWWSAMAYLNFGLLAVIKR